MRNSKHDLEVANLKKELAAAEAKDHNDKKVTVYFRETTHFAINCGLPQSQDCHVHLIEPNSNTQKRHVTHVPIPPPPSHVPL